MEPARLRAARRGSTSRSPTTTADRARSGRRADPDPARTTSTSPLRADTVGAIFAIEEADPASPGASIDLHATSRCGAAREGDGDFDAREPGQHRDRRDGGVWFGTDGNFGAQRARRRVLLPRPRSGAPGRAAGRRDADVRPARSASWRCRATPRRPARRSRSGHEHAVLQRAAPRRGASTAPGRRMSLASEPTAPASPASDGAALLVRRSRRGALAALLAAARAPAARLAAPELRSARDARGRRAATSATARPRCRRSATRRRTASRTRAGPATRGRRPERARRLELQERVRVLRRALDEPLEEPVRDRSAAVARDRGRRDPRATSATTTTRRSATALAGVDRLSGLSCPTSISHAASTTTASRATAAAGARCATSRSPAPSGRPTAAPTTCSSGCRREFRQDAQGRESRAVYRVNLAILEAAHRRRPAARADGRARARGRAHRRARRRARSRRRRPARGRGDARARPAAALRRRRARGRGAPLRATPQGTEFLHTVRYLDPDRARAPVARMKELRYSRKVMELDDWAISRRATRTSTTRRTRASCPSSPARRSSGCATRFGWQLQGFIEDARGAPAAADARRSTASAWAATRTSASPSTRRSRWRARCRARAGWRHQDLRGHPGRAAGRSRRSRDARVLPARRRWRRAARQRRDPRALLPAAGVLDEAEVRRAAPGGDRDLAALLDALARARAAARQGLPARSCASSASRRDATRAWARAATSTGRITNGSTGLGRTGGIHLDGQLHLDWGHAPFPVSGSAARSR